jgi:hypothetical protein
MNLLDRLWRIIPVLLIGILVGCEESNEIGDVLTLGENNIEVLYKEISLPAKNVYIDSIRTDNDGRILVGNYNDPDFGHTVATAYSQFGFFNTSFQPRKDSNHEFVIDSAFVDLIVSYYHSNDSLQSNSFEFHTLADTLINNVYFLSSFKTPYNSEIVSSTNSFTNVSLNDTLRVKLTNAFSNQLLEHLDESVVSRYLLDDSDNVTDTIYNINPDALKNYFKGLAIVASPSNNSIIGFNLSDNSSNLGIYFKIKGETESQEVSSLIEFTTASTYANYYSLEVDRSSTTLNILNKDESLIDPILTDNSILYLQPGSGVHPIINFKPYLDFVETLDNIIINRADISLSVTDTNSSFKYFNKPTDLRFFLYSGGRNINVTGLLNNSIDNTLILNNNTYFGAQLTHFRPVFNETENSYSGDITLFSQFVESGDIKADSLIVIPTDVSSMNRVIFDGNSVKMKIYYTVPK